MPRPGTDVVLVDLPNPVSLPSDTGTAFVVGETDRGPTVATLIQSLSQFVTAFGDRQSYSSIYDWLDEFFHDGGNRAYIGRVVGLGATLGSLNLADNAAAVSLVAKGIGPGAWSADYKVAVVAGTGTNYQIEVTDTDGNILENSGDLVDQNAGIYWSRFSKYIRLTLGVSLLNPAPHAATALSAGTDDRASIGDADWVTALNLFGKDLGPGQVVAPGRTTSVGWSQLTDHAEANNRVALIDMPNTPTVATLLSDAAALQSRFGAAFAPWIIIPGLVSGTQRTVPPSALAAGLIAKNDPTLGPDRPSAGNAGISLNVTDISQPAWDDDDSFDLNEGKVNIIRNMTGGVRIYGWRSLTDPVTDPDWRDFGNARLLMAIRVALDNISENYVFEDIDGVNGSTLASFNGALTAELMRWYQRRQLFSTDGTAATAFTVDTGSSVNTLTTMANLELHAKCSVRCAPFAEYVEIDVVKLAVNG